MQLIISLEQANIFHSQAFRSKFLCSLTHNVRSDLHIWKWTSDFRPKGTWHKDIDNFEAALRQFLRGIRDFSQNDVNLFVVKTSPDFLPYVEHKPACIIHPLRSIRTHGFIEHAIIDSRKPLIDWFYSEDAQDNDPRICKNYMQG